MIFSAALFMALALTFVPNAPYSGHACAQQLSPLQIINDRGSRRANRLGDTSGTGEDAIVKQLNDLMGFSTIVFILDYLGLASAIIVIICSVIVLLVVNYPKTVAQTKQRIAQALLTVIAIAALPTIADAVYTLVRFMM